METSEETTPWEYQVFAQSFKTPGAVAYFRDHLPTEDVGLVHGETGLNQFYLAITDFYDKTGLDPIEPLSFRSWLSSETEIEAALGGPEGVEVFMGLIDSVKLSTPEATTRLLKYRANKRRQQMCMAELQELLDRKEHLSEAEHTRVGLLTAMIRTIADETAHDPLRGVKTGNDLADTAEKLWDLPNFLKTGYKALNRALGYTEDGGVVKGALTAVLAQSGKGKSTFVKCLTNQWLDAGYSVLYINFEEVEDHWERILMTQITGANAYKHNQFDDIEKGAATLLYQQKLSEWGDRIMVQHQSDSLYFEDVESWLRQFIGNDKKAPDAIVIDTIQSMFMKSANGKPRWAQFEEMMVHLEKLAKDLGSAIILTAQENTNRMKEKRDVVMQSDTGGSIAIVQKCSVTIHLVEKKLNGDDSLDENLIELQIPKNRITGTSFAGDPPNLLYNDDSKSFIEIEMESAVRYDPDSYYEMEVEDFDI